MGKVNNQKEFEILKYKNVEYISRIVFSKYLNKNIILADSRLGYILCTDTYDWSENTGTAEEAANLDNRIAYYCSLGMLLNDSDEKLLEHTEV